MNDLAHTDSIHFPEAKRAHETALNYWKALKKDRPFPREDEVDSQALASVWDSCFLVTLLERNNGAKGFHYEYVGKELLEAYGQDMTGLTADHDDAPQIASMLHAMERAGQGEPVLDESVFINRRHLEIRYRCCLLPLGSNGRVEYILGCMRWKLC